jgi:hypothetical protein
MTLYRYNLLQEGEKAAFVWQQGVFVGDRAEGEISVLLYNKRP